MAISFIESLTASGASSSVNIANASWSGNRLDGDFLIASVFVSDDNDDVTPPTGWTELSQCTGMPLGPNSSHFYTKYVTATDSGDYTFTWGTASQAMRLKISWFRLATGLTQPIHAWALRGHRRQNDTTPGHDDLRVYRANCYSFTAVVFREASSPTVPSTYTAAGSSIGASSSLEMHHAYKDLSTSTFPNGLGRNPWTISAASETLMLDLIMQDADGDISTAPTITDMEDELFTWGETGIVITGTNFSP